MSWNPRSPGNWARLLGLVAVPLFGNDRRASSPGTHVVLLDGALSSLTFSRGNAKVLLDSRRPAQWAWSSNINHSIIVDSKSGSLFSVRCDHPNDIHECSLKSPDDAQRLLSDFADDQPESAESAVGRTINVFRSLRTGFREYRGNDLDAIRGLNVLLLWADAIRTHKSGAEELPTTLGGAVDFLRNKGSIAYRSSDFSPDLHQFPISEIAEQLLDQHNGYQLDPYLLVRHASGALYQEAHIELYTPSLQRHLFPTLQDNLPKPTGEVRRDTRHTPVVLARFLSEQAIHEFWRLNPGVTEVEILDPACGSGVFLIEAARAMVDKAAMRLRGVDNSKASVLISDFVVRQAAQSAGASRLSVAVNIEQGDSLKATAWGSPDIILMNPPFLPWRAIDKTIKDSVKEALGKLYVGQSDTAIAFVARAIKELKSNAVFATLVPAPFLSSRAAERLRAFVMNDPSLSVRLIGRFRGYKFFTDAAVEPAFLVVSRDGGSHGRLGNIIAENGFADRAIRAARACGNVEDCAGDGYEITHRPYDTLGSHDWTPRPVRGMARVEEWFASGMPRVTDLFDVYLGIRTGCNPVFIASEEEVRADGISRNELSYFRPLADIRNGRVIVKNFVFYPYSHGRLLLKSEADLKSSVPWFYAERLLPNQSKLAERKSLRTRKWWELVEPRPKWMDTDAPRFLSPAFGYCGSFAYDPETQYAVVQGNAWLWRSRSCNKEVLFAYLALLNSYEFESLLELLCPRVAGGQYELYQKNLAKVPLPDLSRVRTTLRRNLAASGEGIYQGVGPYCPEVSSLVSRAYGVAPDIFRTQFVRGTIGVLRKKFDRLAARWKEDTSHLSNIAQRVRHPAYHEIVSMGLVVIPFLVRELADDADDWFLALEELVGETPVTEDMYGDFDRITAAWLQWAKDKGYDW